MKKHVGIDLGTTNCCVAVVDNGEAKVIEIDQRHTMPSIIAQQRDGTIIVGTRAKVCKDPLYRYSFVKRHMGLNLDYPFKDRSYSPPEISACYLAELKKKAEEILGAEIAAVITVPAHFEENHMAQTRQAAEIADLELLEIIREPNAAAIAYLSAQELQNLKHEVILVYDLGGGTMDATVCIMKENHISVGAGGKAYGGDKFLGGFDFDKMLIQHIKPILKEKGFQFDKIQLDDNKSIVYFPPYMWALLKEAEKVKIELSKETIAEWNQELELTENNQLIQIHQEIKRSEFNKLVNNLLEDTLKYCDEALLKNGKSSAGIKGLNDLEIIKQQAQSLNTVILVGGSSRIPYVKEKIEKHLKEKYNAKPPIKLFKPDECVAIGAAYHAETFSINRRSYSEKINFVWDVPPKKDVPIDCEQQISLSGTIEGCSDADVMLEMTIKNEKNNKKVTTQQVAISSDFKFVLPAFNLQEGKNELQLTLKDKNGSELTSHKEIIIRGGITINPGGLARDIYIRLTDRMKILLPQGTQPGTSHKETFYTSDDSNNIIAPLFEGYHPIGTLEFEANGIANTPVDLETNYESGKINVDVTIKGNHQKEIVTLKPLTIDTNRQKLMDKFYKLQESIASIFKNWPSDIGKIAIFKQECQALYADLTMEFENPIFDVARIDDRLSRLEILNWKLNQFSNTKEGIETRINYFRKILGSQWSEIEGKEQFFQKLEDIETKLSKTQDQNVLITLNFELDEVEIAIASRIRKVTITSNVIDMKEKELIEKINKIYDCGNLDNTTTSNLKEIENVIKKIQTGNLHPSERYNRLLTIEFDRLRPIYYEKIVKASQKGLLRS